MRKVLVAAVGTLTMMFAGGPVLAQSLDVSFVNRTGATLYYLYASPTTADSWGEDLLGATVLADGELFRARLRAAQALDVRAVDSGDNEYIVWGRSVADGSRIVIGRDSFVGVADLSGSEALAWLSIRNNTNYPIVGVYAVPAGSDEWDAAPPLLAAGGRILDGEAYRVRLDTPDPGVLVYDVMLVDGDGDRYLMEAVDLEITTEVDFTLDQLVLR